MNKNQKKSRPDTKLTWIGHFVYWADNVEIKIGKRIFGLALMIGLASFALQQQNADWDFFRGQKIVRAESPLPQFAPKKEVMQAGSLRCGEKKPGTTAVGTLSVSQFAIKKNIAKIIQNKPMQSMIEAVAQRDTQTAAYLVAIAKKESNLGKFSPKDKNGEECYNYWGYRGNQNTTQSGYSCFDTPEQAVAAVGDRIQYLTQVGNYDTPQKMSVWKCGFDCSWDNPAAVRKWISDVGFYHDKISNNL